MNGEKENGFPLCRRCAAAYNKTASASDEKTCHVCKGACANIDSLIQAALGQSKGYDWKTFSITSSIPKEILVREEALLDEIGMDGVKTLKNVLNAEISEKITRLTGAKNSSKNPDAIITIDFLRKKGKFLSAPLYIFGRYLKFSREMPQSKWGCGVCGGKGCDKCAGTGKRYLALEDILADMFRETCESEGTKFHSAGREDIDARMLGEGRPFVIELESPKKREVDLKKIEEKMNARADVGVRGLRFVPSRMVQILSWARFDKEYEALVELEGKDEHEIDEAIRKIEGLSGVMLLQQTPSRVLHRRADKVRERIVKKVSVSKENDKSGKALLRVKVLAQAGTYIKELVHGDNGRTKPSIAELVGPAKCISLDVIRIRDKLLEDCL